MVINGNQVEETKLFGFLPHTMMIGITDQNLGELEKHGSLLLTVDAIKSILEPGEEIVGLVNMNRIATNFGRTWFVGNQNSGKMFKLYPHLTNGKIEFKILNSEAKEDGNIWSLIKDCNLQTPNIFNAIALTDSFNIDPEHDYGQLSINVEHIGNEIVNSEINGIIKFISGGEEAKRLISDAFVKGIGCSNYFLKAIGLDDIECTDLGKSDESKPVNGFMRTPSFMQYLIRPQQQSPFQPQPQVPMQQQQMMVPQQQYMMQSQPLNRFMPNLTAANSPVAQQTYYVQKTAKDAVNNINAMNNSVQDAITLPCAMAAKALCKHLKEHLGAGYEVEHEEFPNDIIVLHVTNMAIGVNTFITIDSNGEILTPFSKWCFGRYVSEDDYIQQGIGKAPVWYQYPENMMDAINIILAYFFGQDINQYMLGYQSQDIEIEFNRDIRIWNLVPFFQSLHKMTKDKFIWFKAYIRLCQFMTNEGNAQIAELDRQKKGPVFINLTKINLTHMSLRVNNSENALDFNDIEL